MEFFRKIFGASNADKGLTLPLEVREYNLEAAVNKLKTLEDCEKNQRQAFELYRQFTGYEKTYEDALLELENGSSENETIYRTQDSQVRIRFILSGMYFDYKSMNVPMLADGGHLCPPAYYDLVQKFIRAGVVIKIESPRNIR